uniref:Uncharacterized protein n=1 Tax=Glossina palpalis gambiensis TaxID=67801 RepID=A0A1B0AX41_9MUSC
MLHVVVLARLVKVPLPPAALLLEFVLLSAAQLFTLPGERHLSNDKCCLARLKVERNWELPLSDDVALPFAFSSCANSSSSEEILGFGDLLCASQHHWAIAAVAVWPLHCSGLWHLYVYDDDDDDDDDGAVVVNAVQTENRRYNGFRRQWRCQKYQCVYEAKPNEVLDYERLAYSLVIRGEMCGWIFLYFNIKLFFLLLSFGFFYSMATFMNAFIIDFVYPPLSERYLNIIIIIVLKVGLKLVEQNPVSMLLTSVEVFRVVMSGKSASEIAYAYNVDVY